MKANQQNTTSKMAKPSIASIICATLFAILLALFVAPQMAQAQSIFASGTGTSEDPYIITTVDQFKAFRDAVNRGNAYAGETIALDADLNLSGQEWTPIGAGTRRTTSYTATTTPFKGVFNGKGHTISGLTITKTSGEDYAIGLFGIVDGGVIENFALKDVNINVDASGMAGAAVGFMLNGAGASNIQVSGTVSAGGGVGGICGKMIESGTIAGCTNNATVRGTSAKGNVGGIVGAAYYTRLNAEMHLTQCTNNGEITGHEAVGGIVGLSAATVSNCTNTAPITGATYSIGGIVGEQRNYGIISACSNSAAVTNTSSTGYGTGGIVGWIRYNGAKTAYASCCSISVLNNANSGAIKGGTGAGGIVGVVYDAATITGNENTAPSISDANFAAGIAGDLQKVDVVSLPAVIKLGITVENNVSTTPMDSIAGADKDQFAYNNDPLDFIVQNNGTAWVAQVGTDRFATLTGAFDHVNQTTSTQTTPVMVQLIADGTEQPTATLNTSANVELDLAGHNIDFAKIPAFDLQAGTLTIVGEGRVLSDTDELASLVTFKDGEGTTTDDHATPAKLELKGGTYKQDVEPYVAEGYTQVILPKATDEARFMVTKATPDEGGDTPPTPDTPDTPDKPDTPDTPGTTPDNPDKPDTPDTPGTTTPTTPDKPNTEPSDNQTTQTPGTDDETQAGTTTADDNASAAAADKATHNAKNASASTTAAKGKIVKTGDFAMAPVVGVLALVALASIVLIGLSRKKSASRK